LKNEEKIDLAGFHDDTKDIKKFNMDVQDEQDLGLSSCPSCVSM
jgi:hypothetical protein